MNPLFRPTLALGLMLGAVRLTAAGSMNMNGEILASYVKVSAALAADDLAAAKTAAAAVAEHAGMSGQKDIAANADAVAKAGKIDAARTSFKALSTAVEPLAAGQKNYVVMNCPMANADWVQTGTAVKNPYYGKAMLNCGAQKKAK